jgi:hypothetical protein
MRQSLAIALAYIFGGGCSLIYNPNSLGQPDDAKVFLDAIPIDASIDAPPVLDADPTMLAIDDVFPKTIYAGQGSNGSFPVTLAIHGKDIVDGFALTITGSSQVHVIGTPVHSPDRDWIAAQLEIDTGSAGSDTPLTISVSEPDNGSGGMSMAMSGKLVLANPPSLTGSGAISMDVSTLASVTYQVINAPKLTFSDTGGTGSPIYLKSYSSITLGSITARGGAGTSGGAIGAAGFGGCAGGDHDQPGQCSQGGGGGASATNGGGGGGFAQLGGTGVANVPGGAAHGSDDLVNLLADQKNSGTNQSAGGGGGGLDQGIGGSAGTGGGGGGTIVIEAGGTIGVTSVDVGGGAGGNGTSGLLVGGGGGGGGGTGGVIVLRSAGSKITAGTLAAAGGGGGSGGGGGNVGGAGSPGRIRIDTNAALPMTSMPPHQGPVFDPTTPTSTTDINQNVTMIGQSGDTVTVYDVDGSGSDHTGEAMNVPFDTFGHATIRLSLIDGYNLICATLDDGMSGNDLADTCFEIVYLP